MENKWVSYLFSFVRYVNNNNIPSEILQRGVWEGLSVRRPYLYLGRPYLYLCGGVRGVGWWGWGYRGGGELHLAEELWAMKLGLKLLQERAKKGSFWWPYISNLPETYTVPIFFPAEDIKNLQYAPLLYQVNKRCRCGFICTLGWAMSAVSSRAFRLYGSKRPDGTRSNVPMMLPLIDMCNHSFDPNAEIVQEEKNGNSNILVKVVAGREIKQNDPLLLNYGCLSSDLFLLDYGFVIQSNPYDCIELRYDAALLDAASMAAGVSSPNFSSPSPWQQQILSHLNLDGQNSDLKVTLGGRELVEGRLLAALRVILSNDEDAVKQHNLEALNSLAVEAPLGISTEVSALRTVVALCVIALGHFPTKIMEDEWLLKQNVSPTTELALQFRIQKKSLIVDVMRDLSKRGRKFDSPLRISSSGAHTCGKAWALKAARHVAQWVRSPSSLVDGACGGVNFVALIRWTQADTDHVCTSRDLPGGGGAEGPVPSSPGRLGNTSEVVRRKPGNLDYQKKKKKKYKKAGQWAGLGSGGPGLAVSGSGGTGEGAGSGPAGSAGSGGVGSGGTGASPVPIPIPSGSGRGGLGSRSGSARDMAEKALSSTRLTTLECSKHLEPSLKVSERSSHSPPRFQSLHVHLH
ncbi:hypothetical protein RND71_007196 [Anisodus tanguticus]|uniref:SET domain-containing protein n=1 Tax=Anisodus tanguticus TaxID=243964 RepID=A0AAE1VJW9_9SOLA|nr:hypothetical protein RND71_007196 [Anisodus tanguticus]